MITTAVVTWRLLLFVSAAAAAATQTSCTWDALNATVNGRLHALTPWALPCFSSYDGNPVTADTESCDTVRENYAISGFRADQPSGFYHAQSEVCLSDPRDECQLDNSVRPAATPAEEATCNQGSVPLYYIDVQNADGVAAAFAFSKCSGVPLSIKNSGHDYLTRNSQKGSLMLWMHNLQDMSHHDDFVPQGCESDSGVDAGRRAMTVGTGVSTHDALVFAHEHDDTIVVGYSPQVAVSGGWLLGGGHGVLSPAFGLGVDRVLEFTIVTPDGKTRVANKCQNSDLFWALRGGGGGTFGVVLEAVHAVEPSMPIAVANIRLPSNASVETSLQWIELMVRESLNWGRQGWGGHAAGLYMVHMNPLPPIASLDDGGAVAQASLQAATDFALSVGGTSVIEVLPDYLSVWNKYVLNRIGGSGIQIPTSRLIPNDLFSSYDGVERFMDYIRTTRDMGFNPRTFYAPVDTPFVAQTSTSGHDTGHDTSVHPAWYKSLWSITSGAVLPYKTTYATRLQNMTTVTEVTILMEQLTGDEGATYPNEGNPFTQDWRKQWWGDNYDRLLEIKREYDPDSLLKCWKCVGFDDDDMESERFRCQGKLQHDIDEALS